MSLHRCPYCRATAPAAARCLHCEGVMRPDETVWPPIVHSESIVLRRGRLALGVGAGAGAAGAVAGALATVILAPLTLPVLATAAGMGLASGLVGAGTALWQTRRAGERAGNRTSIAEARDGLVEVAGRVRVRRPAFSAAHGHPCAAYRTLRIYEREDWSLERGVQRKRHAALAALYSAVGDVEVDDGSGVLAVVRNGPCVLLDPVGPLGDRCVEDGAWVLLRGRGVVRTDPGAAGTYRVAGRFLEVGPDGDRPVAIGSAACEGRDPGDAVTVLRD